MHVIGYDGKDSLLAMLDEAEVEYLNLLEEAARLGWLSGEVVREHDEEIASIVLRHSVPL